MEFGHDREREKDYRIIHIYFIVQKSVGGEATLASQRMIMELDQLSERQSEILKKLSAKTGMPITQENGQRRYGPPPDFKGPPAKGKL
jgi:hypothetical protein